MKLRYVLYHGDAEIALKKLESNSVHLVFTSPPYWSMRGEINWKSFEEYYEKMKRIMKEVYRVLRYGRVVVVNMSDYIEGGVRYDLVWEWHKLLKEVGFKYRDWIIWEKPNELMASGAGHLAGNFIKYKLPMYYNPDRVHEVLLVFSKGDVRIPNPTERVKELSRVDIDEVRDYVKSVWHIPTRQDPHHPAVFPFKLAELVITFYSYVGETVLDPFLGTGTTMVAAKKLKRSAVGCEINLKYISVIKKYVGWGEMSVTDDFQYEYRFEVVE